MKSNSNKDTNKADFYQKKLPVIQRQSGRSHGPSNLMKISDKPTKEINNKKTLTEIHNDEKLAIRFFVMGA